MNNRQMITVVTISTVLTLILTVGIFSVFDRALAAPLHRQTARPTGQDSVGFMSISALAFEPTQPGMPYFKDVQRQILRLTSSDRNFIAGNNIFVAPLTLQNDSQIVAMSLFGEDFDNQGEIRLRLKRCDHSQARCVIIAETSSTSTSAQGQFETPRIGIANETVNNRFFTYFLELELTALFNSGPRSVRLEVTTPTNGGTNETGSWSLSGDVYRFTLPNSNRQQVRICAGDLSHLNNATHYPYIVVDGTAVSRLVSNACQTVTGRDIEIRRDFNTGPSSGTYEF